MNKEFASSVAKLRTECNPGHEEESLIPATPRLTTACTRPRIAPLLSARRRASFVECAAGDAGRYAPDLYLL